MSRKPLPDDAVYGTAAKIAVLIPTPVPTLIRLQSECQRRRQIVQGRGEIVYRSG